VHFRTAITWALHALAVDASLQSRLRDELRSLTVSVVSHGEPLSTEVFNALSSLPLLDAVVRETLRLQAPTPNTFRVATCSDVIPLNDPFVGKDGITYHSLRYALSSAMRAKHDLKQS
jgi:cytochrome P450